MLRRRSEIIDDKAEFEKRVEGASHKELSDVYESERQDRIKNEYNNRTGEKTPLWRLQ